MDRHHYVPQFYLREWYEPGTSEFWVYFRNAQGTLRSLRKPSKAIAYLEGLYTIKPDSTFPEADHSKVIENEFFGPIDNDASIVRKKILSKGLNSLSAKDRLEWAVFIVSLLERSPERIEEVVSASYTDVVEILEHFKTAFGDRISRPEIHHLLTNLDPAVATKNAVLHAMTMQIKDQKLAQSISSMNWSIVRIPMDEEHFLTCDNPVVVNAGNGEKHIHCLSIALTPKDVLVMCTRHADFDEEFIRHLVTAHNGLIVQQTHRYLVSSRKLKDARFTKYEKLACTLLPASPAKLSSKREN